MKPLSGCTEGDAKVNNGPTELKQDDQMATDVVDSSTKLESAVADTEPLQKDATSPKKLDVDKSSEHTDSAVKDSVKDSVKETGDAKKEIIDEISAMEIMELVDKEDEVSRKRAGNDMDFDVDPLKLACQVAIEAKMEVDGREHSASSSDKLPGGEVQQNSPEIESEMVKTPEEDDSSSAPDSDSSSLPEEEEKEAVEADDTSPAKPVAVVAAVEQRSQVTETEAAKGVGFDLNMVVPEDQEDLPGLVSASMASAGQPTGLLQFSGVTSAFRAESPRRNPNSAAAGDINNKMTSTNGSTSSSKLRDDCLDIDLNAVDPVQSGESVVGGDKIGFDLNLASEEGGEDAPSSSSSSKHPRNIDLNMFDQPESSQNHHIADHWRPGGNAVTIMGRKVETGRLHYNPPPPPPPQPQPVQIYPGAYAAMASSLPHYPGMGSLHQFTPAHYAPAQYSWSLPGLPQLSAHHSMFLSMAGGPASNGTGLVAPAQQPFYLMPAGSAPSPSIPHHQPFFLNMAGGGASHGPGPGAVSVPPRTGSWDVSSSQASSSSGAGAKRRDPEGGRDEPSSFRNPRTWM